MTQVKEYQLESFNALIEMPKVSIVLGIVTRTPYVFVSLLVLQDSSPTEYETRCFETFENDASFVKALRYYVGTYEKASSLYHVFERKISK